jgi:hypothetical protein
LIFSMNLFKETEKFISWFQQVLLTFLRIRPWTTTGIVAMSAASRITTVLTTFLPLKVVLLAGSDGVPRYFRFFMDPEHKDAWIFALALGAVACYAVTVWLDSLTGRLSRAAGEEILREAETIPIMNNQEDAAGNHYAKFCRILADGIFVLAAVLGGLFVNFWLFVFIPSLMLCFFSLSALFLRTVDRMQPSGIAVYIQENLSNYTKTLSNVVFFSGFIFLLIPFLVSDYSNILAAILSIIIIRQLLGAQTGIVRNAVQLGKSRHEINALIFRDVQLVPRESPIEKVHRELFHKEARRRIAEHELSKVMGPGTSPEVSWLDPIIPGLDTFMIKVRSKSSGENRCLLQQVFPPKQYQRLEHELFLFRHIPRAHLAAPELVSMFFAGPFQCLICDYGSGRPTPNSDWPDVEHQLTQRMWSCRPPDELVRIYSASAPLLHHRFNGEIADRLEIAADTEEEMEKLHRFRSMLPRIREKLQSIPLYVHNSDLNRNSTVQRPDGEIMIISWGRWTLEPLGAGLPHRLRKKVPAELLGKVGAVRKDIPKDLSREDILTAAWCFDLENLVNKKRYKAAFQMIDKS